MTTPIPSAVRAMAAATSALVETYDITDVLGQMLPLAAEAIGAEAAGLLVLQDAGDLELLSSTSHAATELELYQTQAQEGPCIECVRSESAVSASGAEEMAARWPTLGPAMLQSGYAAVHAEPLRWHGRVLGGLNVFFGAHVALDDESKAVTRAFADIVTLAIVQTQQPSHQEVLSRIREALDDRIVIEHAKGVLMHVEELGAAESYIALRKQAAQQGVTVSDLARDLVRRAQSH